MIKEEEKRNEDKTSRMSLKAIKGPDIMSSLKT